MSKTVSPTAWSVHKFGGSSLANADCFRHVATLVNRLGGKRLIVVSAMAGVTDRLLNLSANALSGAPWQASFDALQKQHSEVLTSNGIDHHAPLTTAFAEGLAVLEAIGTLGPSGAGATGHVAGFGELWSAKLLSRLVADAHRVQVLDTRDIIVAEQNKLGVEVDWDASAENWRQWRARFTGDLIIATGFIARDHAGAVTTLGRNGSDFTAAIMAKLLAASELHIWTDVTGVYSADPRSVPEAVPLSGLSYDEACELAYFGAKVIHPQTMAPVIADRIPVFIRSTWAPDNAGTRIDKAGQPGKERPAKGLSMVRDLAALNIEGSGMVGVPGIAQRVFESLQRAEVSVVMISQGSSEHSICAIIRAEQSDIARQALQEDLHNMLDRGQIRRIEVEPDISVLALVGEGMAGEPGVAARLFNALNRARINVRAIAQGSSERNISVAVASRDGDRGLRAAHAGLWLSPHTLSIGLVGPGQVGSALIEQISKVRERLLAEHRLDLRLRAIANSHQMLLADQTLDTQAWHQADRQAFELATFIDHVAHSHLPHSLIVDCTANDTIADHYADWLAQGAHIVTPNKRAGAGPLERWSSICDAANRSGARLRYEATVGAGLPVINTLRDLVDTGDRVLAVDGILSGSLAWLCNRFDGSQPFSSLVREAQQLGFTEPDPRDDLSGMDVARKLVILARVAGYELSLEQVQIESLVPADLEAEDVDDFPAALADHDTAFQQRFASAQHDNQVLRHVARFDGKHASVGLVAMPANHTFANLALTDAVVQFTTDRYRDNPLVVQGPGAGPEVTAAGVFADILRIGTALGAKL